MMDWEVWQQRHEEMVREVELNRLAKALRTHRKKTRGDRTYALAWELSRGAGILLKLVRTLKNTRKGANP
jgi:hypothetical protein